eukprot:CAMPEP_0177766100 /NCGR_PEP_ID=MMETSP0491_2-20121128/8340_1 /TAXON_ID=63592 /ORGANISM="Tetraselmis chuii, Strain PLY429" /LENGTH=508 /DNA_ID=CAMNT_0019282483 /DNA_START=215 /DNA_END=1741 /DNA_ORIENTATION=+
MISPKTRRRALALLALTAALLHFAAGLYEEGGDVTILSTENFAEEVLNSNAVAMVEFYAPWCGHCQKLAPEYAKVAKSLKGIAVVGAVDCDAEPKLCGRYGVKGFPTMKLFPGERTSNPYTGEVAKLPQDYTGAHTASAIAKALKAALPQHLDSIATKEDWATFKAKTTEVLPAVLLTTSASSTTPLYKSLALRFKGRLHFGEVHADVAAGLPDLEVGSLPQLSVTMADGTTHLYSGDLKAGLIAEFLEQYAGPVPSEEPTGGKGSRDKGTTYSPPGLTAIAPSELSSRVLEEERAVLVAFVGQAEGGDGGCTAALDAVRDALVDFNGMLPMYSMVLDAEDAPEGLTEGEGTVVEALRRNPCVPQIALWPYGADEKEEEEPEVFAGDLANSAELQAFIHAAFPNLVLRLHSAILQQYLAADTEKPKVLLLTAKEETPAVFRALAMNFQNDFGFAEIHKDDKEVRPAGMGCGVRLFGNLDLYSQFFSSDGFCETVSTVYAKLLQLVAKN